MAIWLLWETPDRMTDAERESVLTWLRSHGIDPATIGHRVVVGSYEGDKQPLIHCSRYLTNEQGLRYISDYSLGLAATEPLVVPLHTTPPVGADTTYWRTHYQPTA